MTPQEEAWECLNSRLEVIEEQRNKAHTEHAIAAGELALERLRRMALQKELDQFKATVADLSAKLAALVTPQEA